MQTKCAIVECDSRMDDTGKELRVNQVLSNWINDGWTLVSTDVVRLADVTDVWLFFRNDD